MKVCICVSGIKYRVSCEAEASFPEFAEYACEDSADCVDLCVSTEDIAAEKSGDLAQASERNLLKAAILRKVAEESLKRGRMLVHGACIAHEGKGYLFTAPSGTGKTTHIRLWKKHLGDAVTVVNGDKPILGLESPITVYGTPWAGKEGYQTNTSVPLCAVVEVVQGEKNVIKPVDKAQAFTWLYQHSYLGEKDAARTRARMEAVRKLVTEVPVYRLECDMSDEAFVCSFEALTGKDAHAVLSGRV